MAKGYRNQALPGVLRCIDYMRGSKSKVNNTEPKIENKPPAYNFGDGQNIKTKQLWLKNFQKKVSFKLALKH